MCSVAGASVRHDETRSGTRSERVWQAKFSGAGRPVEQKRTFHASEVPLQHPDTAAERSLIGLPIRKLFRRFGHFNGTVTNFDEVSRQFTVEYEDGERESMSLSKLKPHLLAGRPHSDARGGGKRGGGTSDVDAGGSTLVAGNASEIAAANQQTHSGKKWYEVQAVIGERTIRKGQEDCTQVLVLWKGFGLSRATWEPILQIPPIFVDIFKGGELPDPDFFDSDHEQPLEGARQAADGEVPGAFQKEGVDKSKNGVEETQKEDGQVEMHDVHARQRCLEQLGVRQAGGAHETAEGGDREASKASSISRGQHKDADMQHDASRNQEDNGGGGRKYGNGGQERTEGGHGAEFTPATSEGYDMVMHSDTTTGGVIGKVVDLAGDLKRSSQQAYSSNEVNIEEDTAVQLERYLHDIEKKDGTVAMTTRTGTRLCYSYSATVNMFKKPDTKLNGVIRADDTALTQQGIYDKLVALVPTKNGVVKSAEQYCGCDRVQKSSAGLFHYLRDCRQRVTQHSDMHQQDQEHQIAQDDQDAQGLEDARDEARRQVHELAALSSHGAGAWCTARSAEDKGRPHLATLAVASGDSLARSTSGGKCEVRAKAETAVGAVGGRSSGVTGSEALQRLVLKRQLEGVNALLHRDSDGPQLQPHETNSQPLDAQQRQLSEDEGRKAACRLKQAKHLQRDASLQEDCCAPSPLLSHAQVFGESEQEQECVAEGVDAASSSPVWGGAELRAGVRAGARAGLGGKRWLGSKSIKISIRDKMFRFPARSFQVLSGFWCSYRCW